MVAWKELALLLGALSLPVPAVATVQEREFVGSVESREKVGGGGRHPTVHAATFGGSGIRLGEGPPVGRSRGECDPSEGDASAAGCRADYLGVAIDRSSFSADQCATDGPTDAIRDDGCPGGGDIDFYTGLPGSIDLIERFHAVGAIDVSAFPSAPSSPNGYDVWQNFPSDPQTGAVGFPADYFWTFAIERPPVGHLRAEICLDVRMPQAEDDRLGVAATVPLRDLVDSFGWEGPLLFRAAHHRGPDHPSGDSSCPCEDRTLGHVTLPGLAVAAHPLYAFERLPALGLGADPSLFDTVLDESLALAGRGCLVTLLRNDGQIERGDFVTVQIKVPSSTRVRVRASQDSLALVYTGELLPGEGAVSEPTPTGSDVAVGAGTTFVDPESGARTPLAVDVSFGAVTAAGETTVTPLNDSEGTVPPAFALQAGAYEAQAFDVSTSAEVDPPIVLCSSYPDRDDDGLVDGSSPAVSDCDLRLLHDEGGAFVDRTLAANAPECPAAVAAASTCAADLCLDPATNRICAAVTSLSGFQLAIHPDGDGDEVERIEDNCLLAANGDQTDSDADGFGNACDPDYDGDLAVGIPDFNHFRGQFGLTSSDPGFDPAADANADGAIGLPDFNVLRRYFGGPPGPSGLGCAGVVPCAP